MESYAGFFKVNETYNSHLYFWFFPSQSKPSEDPVILWLQVSSRIFILLGRIVKNMFIKHCLTTQLYSNFVQKTNIMYQFVFISKKIKRGGLNVTVWGLSLENKKLVLQEFSFLDKIQHPTKFARVSYRIETFVNLLINCQSLTVPKNSYHF